MTFEEHVQNHRLPTGEYDLASAERDRARELSQSPEAIDRLAAKAARDERTQWEKRNTDQLRKQFGRGSGGQQLQLDGMELDVLVPLGESRAAELGDMNEERVRLREDLRTGTHIREIDAYAREMEFWRIVRRMLPPGGTIRDIQ